MLKNPIVLKIWGREKGKVERSVGKLSQNALFSNPPPPPPQKKKKL